MDSNEHNKVIAFDTLFSTNHIQMLKVILPCLDNQTQKTLAVYIKFLELNYTINFYKRNPYPLCGCMEKETSPDIGKLCGELLPYCTESEKKQLKQILSLFENMEMYKQMMQTMDAMKDIMPDMGTAGFGNNFADWNADSSDEASEHPSSGLDIMGILMNMLTPEQKQMYELFGGNQDAK